MIGRICVLTVCLVCCGCGISVPDLVVSSNTIPTADAGPDRNVDTGSWVVLDGMSSADIDGDPLFYSWRQISGPIVSLDNPNAAVTGFVPVQDGVFEFMLTVSDGRGGVDDDTVQVFAGSSRPPGAPNADAGPDQTVDEGDPVTLRGGSSADPNGSPLSYSWHQVSGLVASLSNVFVMEPTLTAPQVGFDAELVFELTVTNNIGLTGTDIVAVVVRDRDGSSEGCDNSCVYAFDKECDDGGPGSTYDGCDYGTDCADCGPREGWIPSKPVCTTDSDCDDGIFCNGEETCEGGLCRLAADPCLPFGLVCDEAYDRCMCDDILDCDDGVFCNGMEICRDGLCQSGTSPCSGLTCDEAAAECVCVDAKCDDGIFCNGVESCLSGTCAPGVPPCATGDICDEATLSCIVPDPDMTTVSTVDEILDASWLFVVYGPNGSYVTQGSAFAVTDSLLATNAHVVDSAAMWIRLGGYAVVRQHETDRELTVSSMWMHPDYTDPLSPDVGIVEVHGPYTTAVGELSSVLTIADNETVRSLDVLDEVRLSGFPGELRELDLIRPRATMLSGHITALRPFNQATPVMPETSMMIQHDMPTTGGTSGSPVVNVLGEVVAVNNAVVEDIPGNPGNGQNNFAIRADALSWLLGVVESGLLAPVDLSPISSEVEDGVWVITWDSGVGQQCLYVENGFIVLNDLRCTGAWIDVVPVEIMYDDFGPFWAWWSEYGEYYWVGLLAVADEQFYVEAYVDGGLFDTGLMTR